MHPNREEPFVPLVLLPLVFCTHLLIHLARVLPSLLCLQTCLSLGHQHQLHISTGKMEFWTFLHHSFQKSSQNLGFIWVHFPGDLALHCPAQEASQSPCYISQLMFFMNSPYPEGRAPGQVRHTASATSNGGFKCSGTRLP